MGENERLWDIFLDVQRGLPRQGPGSDESTRRAISLCGNLPERPRVLDIGCGPGMQTVVLADVLDGQITAVDINREYLDELQLRAGAAGVGNRIELLALDMNELSLAEESFDLIWSEGAAYIVGIEHALATWKRLLKPGGYLAVTELVWLLAERPTEATEFFASEYPAMTDVKGVEELIRAKGYDLVEHFTLPDDAWWKNYYAPMQDKLPQLCEKYEGDDEAMSVVETAQREIEVRRLHGDCYGYEFFVGRKPE